MSAFKTIVFDYDGTLFDTRPAITRCLQLAFHECGRQVHTPEALTSVVNTGLPLRESLIALDMELGDDPGALAKLVTTYRTLYLDQAAPFIRPYPGVASVLAQINASGAKCLIVSNKGAAAILRSLEDNRLANLIERVFGDEPGLPKKPDGSFLTDHVLPQYQDLQPECVLLVGDTEIDILFAKSAGVSSCWASYGYGDDERCRQLAPEHEISSIGELPALVLSGCQG
jgi:phosphoglycolate phosphatase